MATFWDELAQMISAFISDQIPSANTKKMDAAVRDLLTVAGLEPTKERSRMSAPLVSIPQSDIDGWAANVNAAVTALQGIIANGNLTAADESAMNTAIGNLDGVAGTSVTPPAPPAGPQGVTGA